MSYVALTTRQFEALTDFYGKALGFAVLQQWDRPNGRGCVFDLNGLKLEILDAAREKAALELGPVGDRIHLVIEVADVDAAYRSLAMAAPPPVTTSWGARTFSLRDPDGTAVCYLQWAGS
ncbi:MULTISPECIES: VOC family protein [Methylococcus]|uniref:VOC family protein n=1 Tax=Methylococcus capsulatus TaxID=414 RepID=A0ABZ2F4B3_METCP|nr:VOC family protein [Methylococcus capsulatus]MDF9391904.1 VOC family protein [Methylococcus capsulatus]